MYGYRVSYGYHTRYPVHIKKIGTNVGFCCISAFFHEITQLILEVLYLNLYYRRKMGKFAMLVKWQKICFSSVESSKTILVNFALNPVHIQKMGPNV